MRKVEVTKPTNDLHEGHVGEEVKIDYSTVTK